MVIKRVDARRFRSRWSGFTLAEVLVMIVLTASALLPVIGTMHTGVERTVTLEHKARMRTICESWLNHSIASAAYMRQPIGQLASHTISWPDAAAPLATFIVNLDMVENVIIASLPGGLAGDFALMPVSGVQPTHIKAVVVSVYLQNDDVDSATEVVKLGALVSLPRSSATDRLYIANDQQEIMAIDPGTGNILETYALSFRPGNIAVHPEGKFLAIQASQSIQVLNVDLASPNRGSATQVLAPGGNFIVNDTIATGVQNARGIAFRPDGRVAFVTRQNDGTSKTQIGVLSVPSPPNSASWSALFWHQESTSVANVTEMTVGQDGYLYVCYRGATLDRARRLNMYLPSLGLSDFYNPGAAAAPRSLSTTPDGRYMVTGNLDRTFSLISSDIPANYRTTAALNTTNFGPALDVLVTPDGNKVLFTNSSFSGSLKPRLCSIDMAPVFGNGTYSILATASTDMLMISPDKKVFVVCQDSANGAWVNNLGSFTDGTLTSANARVALLGRRADARPVSCAARRSEMAVVACGDGGGNNSLEFVDINLGFVVQSVTLPGSGANARTPLSVCLDAGGAVASIAFQDALSGRMYVQGVDCAAFGLNGAAVDVNPAGHVNWQGPVTPLLGGGCLIGANDDNGDHAFFKVFAPGNPTPVLAASLTPCAALTPYPTLDIAPLNGGGAMILVNNMYSGYSQLFWVSKDNALWAKWDSRYDFFPPEGATRIAVSADDSLLAFYDPTYLGPSSGADNHKVRYFDMRAQCFGSLTQQRGLIEVHQSSTSGNFRSGPKTSSVDCRFTGSGLDLIEAFTCNHPTWPNAKNYPGNYLTPGSTDIYDAGSTRMFGYFYPTTTIAKWANVHDDYGRLILDGNELRNRTNWWPTPVLVEPWYYPVSPLGPVLFQVDNSNVAARAWQGVFCTPVIGDAAAVPGNVGSLYNAPGGSWQRLASASLMPLRLTPQFIDEFDTPDPMYTNSGRIVFSRDTASPTLYFLNPEDSKLSLVQWGKTEVSYSLLATIAAGLAGDITLSPDGQRLLITATSPSRLCIVDVAQPPASTFGKVTKVITLTKAPRGVATRPFIRYGSMKNRWECVATLTLPVAGQHIAAVSYGGVNIVGGAPFETGVATTDAYRLNPLRSTIENVSPGLASPAARHAVVTYDGEFYSFLGRAGGSTLNNVQRWNPQSQLVLGAAPAPPAPVPTGKMSLSNFADTQSSGVMNGANRWESTGHYVEVSDVDNVDGYDLEGWRAFDGSTSNSAYTLWDTDNAKPIWLVYTFPSPTVINRFRWMNNNQWAGCGPNACVIYGSNNGQFYQNSGTLNTTYWQLWSGNHADNESWQDHDFVNTTAYTHYQLKITSGHNSWTGITEMELHNTDPGTPPPVALECDTMSGVENDAVASQARHDVAACLTPYGIVIAGGHDGSNPRDESFVYWPHGVASLVYPPDVIGPVTVPMTNDTTPTPQRTTASGVGGSENPWKAFNGNTGDGWKSDSAVCWIQIDLGAPITLTSIGMIGRGSAECPKHWRLWGSNTDAWTASGTDKWGIASVGNMPQGTTLFTRGLAGTTPYRYYQIEVTENWGDAGKTRINELYLYGAAPPPLFKQVNATMTSDVQPAPNRIKVSHPCNNHRAYLAMNGKTNDYGHINTNANGWIQVDLAQPEVVTKFEVRCDGSNQSLRDFNVWASNDGVTWDTTAVSSASADPPCYALVVTTNQAQDSNWHMYTFGNLMAFKYYRLIFSTNWGHGSQSRISEMRLWGNAYKPLVQWGICRELPSMTGNQPGPTGDCSGHSLVYHTDGYLYRIGGAVDGAYNVCTNVIRFNFSTNTWQAMAAPSQFQRTKAAACSFGDEIFIFGGATGAGPAYTNTAAAWNPTTGAVRNLPPIPNTSISNVNGCAQAQRTYAPCAVPCGPVIYLIGGCATTGSGGGTNILAYYP